MNSENVKIPVSLLHKTVNLLEIIYAHCNALNLAPDFESYVDSILAEFRHKQRSLELRAAYSKISAAKTEDERHFARINYLCLKQEFDSYYYPF
jgi:hypothetical protein